MASVDVKKSGKTKKAEPADSWEDEAEDSSSSDAEGVSTPTRPGTSDLPAPPPPTPATPPDGRQKHVEYQSLFPPNSSDSFDPSYYASAPDDKSEPKQTRPDKTTSVASRLIAAGIGQKAPKRTQEQREYDQAMKIQEKKRRDQAKAEEERKKREKEQAQKDIWGE